MSRYLLCKTLLRCGLDMSRYEGVQVTDGNLTAVWERILCRKGACTDCPLDRFVAHSTPSSCFLDGHIDAFALLFPVLILSMSRQCVQVRGNKSGLRHVLLPSFNRVSAAWARSRHVSTSSCCASQRSRSWAAVRSTVRSRSTNASFLMRRYLWRARCALRSDLTGPA